MIKVLIENLFLGRLTKAITHLDAVVGEGFVFKITPEMMDDEYHDPINIDDKRTMIIVKKVGSPKAFNLENANNG